MRQIGKSLFNPVPPNVYICYRIVKIWILTKEGILEKNPNERLAYESVDERSLSSAITQNLTGKLRSWAVMGTYNEVKRNGYL